MTSAEIKTILEEHSKWLKDNKNGKYANLRGANLRDEDLRDADLRNADLRNADLRWADLEGVDLRGADLRWADFEGANLRGTDLYYPIACPEEGSFIAWKKAENCIVKLEVLEDAKRSSAAGRKCRCDKARVLAIENLNGSESHITEVNSNHDKTFIYRVGEVVSVNNFNENRWKECAPGIHFFITREEAVRYQ